MMETLFSCLCRGYEGLIRNLIRELPSGLVTYNQPVRCIHWNNKGKRQNPVIVECESGERITADHVIVTVPLGTVTLLLNNVIQIRVNMIFIAEQHKHGKASQKCKNDIVLY